MYLMGIHGIHDDAYRYSRINEILYKQHKVYIKKMCCMPHEVTEQDYDDLPMLEPEDKAHLGLIVMETKRRIQLIYLTKILC